MSRTCHPRTWASGPQRPWPPWQKARNSQTVARRGTRPGGPTFAVECAWSSFDCETSPKRKRGSLFSLAYASGLCRDNILSLSELLLHGPSARQGQVFGHHHHAGRAAGLDADRFGVAAAHLYGPDHTAGPDDGREHT